MKVLVLTIAIEGTSPGQRFRWEQWAKYLQREGVRFDFVPFENQELHDTIYRPGHYLRKAALMLGAVIRRAKLLDRMRDYDAVVVYREACLIGPAVVENMIARCGIPLIYDFDDPIWLPYRSPVHGRLTWLKFRGKTSSICRYSRRVIVGNRLLAEWANQHSRHVHVVPSTIDLEKYNVIKPATKDSSVVTIGWTGSHSTIPLLLEIWDALEKLAAQHPFRLVVISHSDSPQLRKFPGQIVTRRWQAETEAVDLQDLDIGIDPLPNSGWAPFRCHGKVLQYMASGIPTVASRVGILPDIIHEGVNGFLAGSTEEWIDRLSRLIRDADLRQQLGKAGRQTMEERFSAALWAPRVREILQSAIAPNHPTHR